MKNKSFKLTTDFPVGIRTPDVVKTSIGTLNFLDGMPTEETVQIKALQKSTINTKYKTL